MAFWGNAPFANDWQWLIGYPTTAALLWIIGYFYAELSGRIEMTLTTGALGVLAAAFVAYIITWLASFVARFLNVPVKLFHEQNDRADKLERLKQLASDVTHVPSFDIGFEVSIDQEKIDRFHEWNIGSSFSIFDTQEICRIWVENLEHNPIGDCRVVIEDFHPNSPVKNGVMLLPDNRGADEETSAKFDLAATEKRYFRFLRLTMPIVSKKLTVVIKSDQDRTGFAGVLDKPELEFGKRYFATIAVHGKNSISRRINLTINMSSEKEIVVAETSPPEQREQEIAQ